MTDIPAARAREPVIFVTFHVDAEGAFSITARHSGTGEDLPVLRS